MDSSVLFLLSTRLPPGSTLFPYTTLFRSDGKKIAFHHRGDNGSVYLMDANGENAVEVIDNAEMPAEGGDRKSTRLNSSHTVISYAVFCLKKKTDYPAITCSPGHLAIYNPA